MSSPPAPAPEPSPALAAAAAASSATLALKNLDYSLTPAALADVLAACPPPVGQATAVAFHRDPATGRFSGVAFLEFAGPADAADAARALEGLEILGRRVRVGFRTRRERAAAAARGEGEADVVEPPMGKEEEMRWNAEVEARLRKWAAEVQGVGKEAGVCTFEETTAEQRKVVHEIAERLRLAHGSQGGKKGGRPGTNRVLSVWKEENKPAAARKSDGNWRERNHAATGDDAAVEPEKEMWKAWQQKKEFYPTPPPTQPQQKVDLSGLKFTVPRRMRVASSDVAEGTGEGGDRPRDGNGNSAKSIPPLVSVQLYVPEHKPTGPDGTRGFYRRQNYAAAAAERAALGLGSALPQGMTFGVSPASAGNNEDAFGGIELRGAEEHGSGAAAQPIGFTAAAAGAVRDADGKGHSS